MLRRGIVHSSGQQTSSVHSRGQQTDSAAEVYPCGGGRPLKRPAHSGSSGSRSRGLSLRKAAGVRKRPACSDGIRSRIATACPRGGGGLRKRPARSDSNHGRGNGSGGNSRGGGSRKRGPDAATLRRRMKRRAEGCQLDSEESLTFDDEDHESLDEDEGEEEEEEIICETNLRHPFEFDIDEPPHSQQSEHSSWYAPTLAMDCSSPEQESSSAGGPRSHIEHESNTEASSKAGGQHAHNKQAATQVRELCECCTNRRVSQWPCVSEWSCVHEGDPSPEAVVRCRGCQTQMCDACRMALPDDDHGLIDKSFSDLCCMCKKDLLRLRVKNRILGLVR